MNLYERYTYEQYLDRALSLAPSPCQDSRSSRSTDPYLLKWSGSPDFDSARKLALEGWTEGRELVGKILAQVESEMEIETTQIGWDVTGDFIDVGAYVTGQPECMMRPEPVTERKRVARIMVNLAVSSGVSTEVIRWRGATVMALIDKLESSGVRVELDAAYACQNYSGDTACFAVNLKRAEEPLHPDLMAFHLTHPSSFRRIFFSFVEQCPALVIAKFGFNNSGSYGTPAKIDKLIPKGDSYDLIVPEMHLYTVKDSIAQIERMFNIIASVKEGELYDAGTE